MYLRNLIVFFAVRDVLDLRRQYWTGQLLLIVQQIVPTSTVYDLKEIIHITANIKNFWKFSIDDFHISKLRKEHIGSIHNFMYILHFKMLVFMFVSPTACLISWTCKDCITWLFWRTCIQGKDVPSVIVNNQNKNILQFK